MSIHVALHHRTTYRYDRRISLGPQVIRLRPAPHCRTPILSYSLNIQPKKFFLNWAQDPHSNYNARVLFDQQTDIFEVVVELVAEMSVYNPFDFFLEPYADEFPFSYDAALEHDLLPYLVKDKHGELFTKYLESIDVKTKKRTIDFLVELNQRLQDDVGYLIRMEPGVQSPEQTLENKSGSCRDSAWLLCQLLRYCGLASRFVSGYLIQLKPDVAALDGPSGATQDFTDLHAWCEVYLPGAGWIGLDPTSGLLAGEGHLPLACTPEPSTAAPISGTMDKAESKFDFDMSVTRVYESPRVTKPYTEEQWNEILVLGDRIDDKLSEGNVRLTMGGEPTFVSIDDMDGAEWNTTAVGPNKRRLGADLLRKLHARFAPGGLLHWGQGKWYPGEQLPRWAFGCFWRKDGVPMWENPDLVAREERDYGVTNQESGLFIDALGKRLGVDTRHVLPAYEDSWYYMWKERRMPSNVDPLKSKIKDEMERARIAKLFDQGLDKIIGHVLPLRRDYGVSAPHWMTGPWFLRGETLFLLPGDSPIGFRLPIDSLPWVSATDYPYDYQPDSMMERPPLPRRPPRDRQAFLHGAGTYQPSKYVDPATGYGEGPGFQPQRPARPPRPDELPPTTIPGPGQSSPWVVRTALCVEPRDGKMHVFMPPLTMLEEYLELTAAVEETADYLGIPVLIEGYPPPGDSRLKVIKVTPDPGVIEVNVHPAESWREQVEITAGVYEDAHQCRLGTEKFMLDGRHTGTGGGNHIVLGGSTPAQSPFLRRPDLLKSLIGYWHNHPSLSYLFSGLFIGPTSQSPRVDEARNDSLYELELAFKQIPDKEEAHNFSPWLLDRVLRNLLTDITGNTHRAEFCIDKMYNPDTSSGRLGLLELRAFEMPPHERMSLAQQLLMRSLIAEFWDKPYERPLVRWGTELHDRFMLPHFVWQDFTDVLEDLGDAGIDFDKEWFAPHYEFKFPLCGHSGYREIQMELRNALEPWHVLGEEGMAGGAVRFVDSSVERMQVKVKGMVGDRYKVLCNGEPVPLHSTGTIGEYVAGVRYRAWQPPSCLHPAIGVDVPLVFDIYDTWNGKTVGGATYHVAHPGGRSHSTFPVNSYEAESRRLSRFMPFGHSPGKLSPHPGTVLKEFPFTLDLRH